MTTDRFTVRTVVVTLAAVVVGGVAAEVFLTAAHTPIPDQLDRIVNLAIGAIAGLLTKTSTGDTDPQPVIVENPETAPVPVDPAP